MLNSLPLVPVSTYIRMLQCRSGCHAWIGQNVSRFSSRPSETCQYIVAVASLMFYQAIVSTRIDPCRKCDYSSYTSGIPSIQEYESSHDDFAGIRYLLIRLLSERITIQYNEDKKS